MYLDMINASKNTEMHGRALAQVAIENERIANSKKAHDKEEADLPNDGGEPIVPPGGGEGTIKKPADDKTENNSENKQAKLDLS